MNGTRITFILSQTSVAFIRIIFVSLNNFLKIVIFLITLLRTTANKKICSGLDECEKQNITDNHIFKDDAKLIVIFKVPESRQEV